jgi:MHS family proline/betaine transporter-like MFS transporter
MIMMIGMLMAVILYRPIYRQMYALSNVTGLTEVEALQRIEKTRSVTASGDSVVAASIIRGYVNGTQVKVTDTRKSPASGDKVKTDTKREVTLGNEGFWAMVGLVLIQVALVTMVYGPIAAFLVELFPTKIRYTSMSLPYHIGNGIFGGLVPFIATSLYESSKTAANPGGDPFAGLWYPIIVAAVCFVIGMITLKNRKLADVID